MKDTNNNNFTNIRKVVLLNLQQLSRLAVNTPIVSHIARRLLTYVRRYFSLHNSFGNLQTKFDSGTKIWVCFSDYIESQIFWQGVLEGDRGEVKLFKSILKPDDVFIDVGANVGLFTLVAAKRLVDGQIHAFEPVKTNLTRLRANLLLNQFHNVVVNAVALSNISSNRDLFIPAVNLNRGIRNTGLASFYVSKQEISRSKKESVSTITLDEYVQRSDLEKVDVIKIDVEGAEMDVLEGGLESLRKFRPIILMEVNEQHLNYASRTIDELLKFWGSLDYSIAIIKHNGRLKYVRTPADFRAHQNICCHPNMLNIDFKGECS